MTNEYRRVDETYIRLKGKWVYLYRPLMPARRRSTACSHPSGMRQPPGGSPARRLPHTVNPRAIAVDKNTAYLNAAKAMKLRGKLWRFAQLRQVMFLNNIVEQDHRRIKRLVRPGLGFKSFTSTSRTIAGYEAMEMIRKTQVVSVPANNMRLSMISLLTYSALLPNLSSDLAFA
ncbi:DDE-type integrase/transposase/recombinase [Microvirga pakistanensis]|uniref:DDE-type integrase/transposase/recombinase n=1 Tax=Microvirga pakistanensis TaxID=1682650 RepID=UPI00195B9170|nr:DDE-type integrase/transposase/recombinase [Microvirga pakistanensis]